MGTTVETPRSMSGEPPQEYRKSPSPHGSIRRILVCVDHSSYSDVALRHAVSVAKTFDSALTLLHVLAPVRENAGLRTMDAYGWEIARQEAGAYLSRLESETAQASGLHVDSRLEQGHPAERITSIAHELAADLTVIGSHGEDALLAWNLGSTAQQVLAAAKGSVLVARSTSRAQDAWEPKRILVPLDGSPRTESVLPTAARIAKAHDAEILLAHLVVEPSGAAMLRAEADIELARELTKRLESSATRYLDNLCEQLGREGLPVRALVVRRADERQSLLDVAQKEHVDLVVVSAHGSNCNPARSFGSVAAHLLAHSPVSLLVLQDLPEAELGRARDMLSDENAPKLRASFAPGKA
jgi:nucleotide-binding universal stress UspA family protein